VTLSSIVEISAPPPSAGRAPSAAPPKTAAAWLVRELERRGIEVVTGIPGGAILPLYDALCGSSIRHVLARHEQGAGFIAQGMARATGRAAVCLATSGPGATNLVTALADALADSVPLVAITAQVPRALIGTDAFQEVATAELMRTVTKESLFVSDPEDLPATLARAFAVAESGRRGPVCIDVPKDVLSGPAPGAAARPARSPCSAPATSRPPRARAGVEVCLDAARPQSRTRLAR
jgi:acetolactate synthase-1/2/3 large subunit